MFRIVVVDTDETWAIYRMTGSTSWSGEEPELHLPEPETTPSKSQRHS